MRHRLAPVVLAGTLAALVACGTDSVGDHDSVAATGTPTVSAVGTDAGAGAATTGSGDAAGATPASAEADLRDVASYRLSMDRIDRYLAAQRNVAMKLQGMSQAERDAIASRNEGDGNASLAQMAQRIEGEPVIAEAVRAAGLSAREYAVLTMAMVQSSMAASVVKTRPNDNRDSLVRAMQASPENVKFILDNEAEIQRRHEALAAEMKRLGIGEG